MMEIVAKTHFGSQCPWSYKGPHRKSAAGSGPGLMCPVKPCRGLSLMMDEKTLKLQDLPQ